MKHSTLITATSSVCFGIILSFLTACGYFSKDRTTKGTVVESDSITQIIIKFNGLNVDSIWLDSNHFRADFDKVYSKDNPHCAELNYKSPDEIQSICDILNSAAPCRYPFRGINYSPQTIAAGKNYQVLDGGLRIYSEPDNVVFKIEIYSGKNCQVIWGGPSRIDTDSKRFETPKALFDEFKHVIRSNTDWIFELDFAGEEIYIDGLYG